ncbi:MAG TPA: HAD family hydrolase [Nannocystis sp.]
MRRDRAPSDLSKPAGLAALALLLACCVSASVAAPSAAEARPAAAASATKSGHRPGWVAPQQARYQPQALAQISERVTAERATGKTPVVVFDLDHTLYDGRPRTLVILAEFAATLPPAQARHAAAIQSIPLRGVAYLLKDTLAAAGVNDPQVVAAAEAYWKPRFFSDAYVDLDVPLPGAAAYVQDLWRRGALVVYLSGRNAEAMLTGTTASLQKWGFPVGVRGAQLILKPTFAEPDETFKQASLDHITSLGSVVASFENEPGNLAAMATRWPAAAHVFLDTDFNPGGAVHTPPASARWVGDYSGYAPPAAPARP